MTSSIFVPGDLPRCYDALIVRDPYQLQGKWKEVDKPFDLCSLILARLGFMSIKRKIVARCHSEMDLYLVSDEDKKSGQLELNIAVPQDQELHHELASDQSFQTASTTPNTSVPPSLPLSPLGHKAQKEDAADVQWNELKWHQRQYFPMGREKSAAFVSDGSTEYEIDDSDTGRWEITVAYIDGRLIQKRHSKSLGLTMYDTRCIMSKKVPYDPEATHVTVDESAEASPDSVWQLFQWTIVDHKKGDEILRCGYYLQKMH
eukprot:Blabericola_migrator_1__4797@NODE_251_length_10854_cov_130_762121_g212_i0_p6_GENE_NODE_251_length_10854_cov_130_762121_g212_i0NODE_251_length_10854_cov_130_762121_g212_i0_p6_ORF_typecomplete_len260_score35_19_NODE_251_length_10854_cov_130_762121_g212_i0143922